MKIIKNVFGANNWFDVNFLGEFLNSDSKIKDLFNEQIYTIKDERISSRVLNHWYEMELINDDRPNKKGWKKFSFSEVVWIEVILKLRMFGLNLKSIKQVKEQIDIYKTSHNNKSKCLLLDFYMAVVLTSTIPVKIIVFESGQAEIVRQIDLDIANTCGFIVEDFISIDLNKLLDGLLKKKNVRADYLNYNISNIAKEIESSLSIDDVKSITIKVKDKDYVIGQEFFSLDRSKAMALMNVLQFGELIEKKNAGKSTYNVINKKKIKK